MTHAQRAALFGLMEAILAIPSCSDDLRERAEALKGRLSADALRDFLRSAGR